MEKDGIPLLETKALAIGYGRRQDGRPLFRDLNLTLELGSLTCLMGPNGAGKSTLIKTLTGLVPPLAGGVLYRGQANLLRFPRERAKVFAVVLTGNSFAGMLRVRELVAIGRHPHTKWTGTFTRRDLEKVDWALGAVGAGHLAERWIHTLSDGERQRVMIARALAQETPLLYLDEPTAYLDLPHKIELMLILGKLARECGLTLVISTHELELALQYADQLWLLGPDGKCACGVPEDLLLDGQLEQAFGREHLRFDRSRGVFLTETAVYELARIAGDPVGLRWTVNALSKLGIGFTENGDARFHIDVEAAAHVADGYRWKVEDLRLPASHRSVDLRGLLQWLRGRRGL
jgi:iron complex transport system ATP-binding protein